MEPYTYRSGEVWGEEAAETPAVLPDVASAGEKFALRARRAKADPEWRERSPQSRETLLRADALSKRVGQ